MDSHAAIQIERLAKLQAGIWDIFLLKGEHWKKFSGNSIRVLSDFGIPLGTCAEIPSEILVDLCM